MANIESVEVVHWNPKQSILPGRWGRNRIGRRFPIKRAVQNFGDLLGPLLVERILAERQVVGPSRRANNRLVAVGSILALAEQGDVIWGAGVNGRNNSVGAAPDIDVRAVRGPITKRMLEAVGTHVPHVFGDPALLWPKFWSRAHYLSGSTPAEMLMIPHFLDPKRAPQINTRCKKISARGDPHRIIGEIVNSKFVVSSSLHGIILAEAYNIPARLLAPENEPRLKYDDYYQATGRPDYRPASSTEEASDLGGEAPALWNPNALLDAFPIDLWRG